MNPAWVWILCVLGAYLAGSIPFGLLIGRVRGVDIRQHGSKNIGATNVSRVLGRGWGWVCFTLDVLKGAAPVALAGLITGAIGSDPLPAGQAWPWLAVAAAAVVGHMHSVFIRFKGGKGVATGFGAMLGMWGYLTWPALIALAVWLIALRATRYVSVASCLAAPVVPLSVLAAALWRASAAGLSPLGSVLERLPFLAVAVVLTVVVIWKHRANFRRLRTGTEPKVGIWSGRNRSV